MLTMLKYDLGTSETTQFPAPPGHLRRIRSESWTPFNSRFELTSLILELKGKTDSRGETGQLRNDLSGWTPFGSGFSLTNLIVRQNGKLLFRKERLTVKCKERMMRKSQT